VRGAEIIHVGDEYQQIGRESPVVLHPLGWYLGLTRHELESADLLDERSCLRPRRSPHANLLFDPFHLMVRE
jgi:hypothetical protein